MAETGNGIECGNSKEKQMPHGCPSDMDLNFKSLIFSVEICDSCKSQESGKQVFVR